MVLSKATGFTNWAAMFRGFTNHQVRNFYFDGHGGPDRIGYGWDTNGEANFYLTASSVAKLLGNDSPGTNSTRYRWVWIDSCSSALGIWPETFGLGTREDVPFTNYVSRPGAFCGFDQDVYGWSGFHGFGDIDIKSINYRSFFQEFWWLYGESIKFAFDDAEYYSDFGEASHLKIYGFWGLGWSQFNTKGEWPP
jgi:hypothetical protein